MSSGKVVNGQVIRAGADISKGYYEYVYDILYSTHFCLVLSLCHKKMIWSFLIIPIAVVIILWKKVISPWLFKSTI